MRTKNIERLIDITVKRQRSELVIKNAKIFNGFTGQFIYGDLAVDHGYIAAIGSYDGLEEFDAGGAYITPGFFDGHVHIESGMASPIEFTRTLAALGTTSIVADPHEIANAAGIKGLEYILEATEDAPVRVYVMLPSCVPATPFEWGGAKLEADDLRPFMEHPRVLGLGEMMNYPGVIGKDPSVMAKLKMCLGGQIDGHAPGLTGDELMAYAAAGIRNDHECFTAEQAIERISLGMAVMMRQGSAARNLINLIPAVNPLVSQFCFMATDDRHPEDLLHQGNINYLVRLAVEDGRIDLPTILRMATLNGPMHYGLRWQGAIAPGYVADLALFSDLKQFWPLKVWKDGRLVAENGQCLYPSHRKSEEKVRLGLKLPDVRAETFAVKAAGKHLRVMGLIPGELLTDNLVISPDPVNGCFVADPDNDLVKAAVFERYRGSGNFALGFFKGLGMKRGAVASTVAHDSHNLIVAGLSDDDMALAVDEARRIGGGLVVACDGNVLGSLPLPLGGIMSDRPMHEIAFQLSDMQKALRSLGLAEGYDPFMTLAFMSLPVIPKLKLTEAGLVDIDSFQIVPLVF